MAGSVNKVILIGNLGRDPEIRFMQDGGKMASLSVATSETWRDKNSGERRERTEWNRVVIFTRTWRISRRSTCARAPRYTWKAPCRPANGRISRVRTAIPPKSSCRGSAAS